MLVLTVVTGLVDAVSFLALGHVFVANMTGNVVFLGLAAAGAAEVSALTSAVAIGAFLVAGIIGGRIARHASHRGHVLATATAVETILVTAAVLVALTFAGEPARTTMIALLSFAMGLQTAAARALAIPDMQTTILTMTLTGLAADSPLAGGTGARRGPRLAAILAMLAGACLGALLTLKLSVVPALIAAALLLAVAALLAHRLSAAPQAEAWTRR